LSDRSKKGPPAADNLVDGPVDVNELLQWEADYNPNEMTPGEFGRLRESIRRFGAADTATVNRRSVGKGWPAGARPCIVGGHHRIRAAKEVGLAVYPVLWVDEDEIGEAELNLALNNIKGSPDRTKLDELLVSLRDRGSDLKYTGFAPEELEAMLGAPLDPTSIVGGDPPVGGGGDSPDGPGYEPPGTTTERPAARNTTVKKDSHGARMTIGEYYFDIPRQAYELWIEELRQDVGFSEDEVVSEIRFRLKIS